MCACESRTCCSEPKASLFGCIHEGAALTCDYYSARSARRVSDAFAQQQQEILDEHIALAEVLGHGSGGTVYRCPPARAASTLEDTLCLAVLVFCFYVCISALLFAGRFTHQPAL